MGLASEIRDLDKLIPDPGTRDLKGTGCRMRIRNTGSQLEIDTKNNSNMGMYGTVPYMFTFVLSTPRCHNMGKFIHEYRNDVAPIVPGTLLSVPVRYRSS
jgi:hypothetical protein